MPRAEGVEEVASATDSEAHMTPERARDLYAGITHRGVAESAMLAAPFLSREHAAAVLECARRLTLFGEHAEQMAAPADAGGEVDAWRCSARHPGTRQRCILDAGHGRAHTCYGALDQARTWGSTGAEAPRSGLQAMADQLDALLCDEDGADWEHAATTLLPALADALQGRGRWPRPALTPTRTARA